ncbi:MAG TPA: GGDEF domain-containing protein, partial [Pseudomonadales bacterium]|nr:GGDEF domain-containing protein [Pseudomonadales bacterium]
TGSRALAQREFENFLLSLNSRLEDVQGFLARSKQGQDQANTASEKLQTDVRDHIALIQSSIQDSDDIGTLKATVRSKLDSILSTIDLFRSEEKSRGSDLVAQIEALSDRMAAMEAEATQLRKTVEEQRANAMKDALTQLPNRQALNDYLDKEFARWQRYKNPLSLVILDVDHFKKINDNYGHLAGDKVLKIVARELAKRIRSADFIARYGGEEFVIIMPETKEDDAVLAVDKAREHLSGVPFHFKEKRVAVTASFGVTQFREGDTIEAAIARADKALYQAKHEGRNKVVKAE